MNIYPSLEIDQEAGEVIIRTAVRKEHKKKWYLWHIVSRNLIADRNPVQVLLESLERLHKEAYNVILVGKVDLSLKYDGNSQAVFELDPDCQISEIERLGLK